MKKMMLVAAVALAGWTVANATEVEPLQTPSIVVSADAQTQDTAKRTQVAPENLPQGIKTALSAEEYTGWTVATAYHVEPEEKEAFYEISLEKIGEEDLRVIKMDAEGNLKKPGVAPPAPPTPPTQL